MNEQDCLQRAMFAASEGYSHIMYDLEDYGCAESSGNKENVTLNTMTAVAFTQAA